MTEKQFYFCSSFSFFLSLFFAAVISRFGSRVGLVDTPNKRSSHVTPTPKSGGIGIWLSFIFVGMFFTNHQILTILASFTGLIGLLDDLFLVSQKLRLVLKLIISALVVSLFLGMPTSITGVLLSLFWLLFIAGTANFYNFMDGIDGIAGLTGLVGFGFMSFFCFYIIKQPDVTLLSTVLAMSCAGFLFYNFPMPKVFMGDVGSLLLGFVFAALVFKLSTSLNMFLCLIMFMCMFYADALATLFCRWKSGENLIMAHRSHLYQYMSNELRIPHWKVSLSYTSTQFVFAALALFAYKKGIVWQIIVFVFFIVMFLVIYRTIKKIRPATCTSQL